MPTRSFIRVLYSVYLLPTKIGYTPVAIEAFVMIVLVATRFPLFHVLLVFFFFFFVEVDPVSECFFNMLGSCSKSYKMDRVRLWMDVSHVLAVLFMYLLLVHIQVVVDT